MGKRARDRAGLPQITVSSTKRKFSFVSSIVNFHHCINQLLLHNKHHEISLAYNIRVLVSVTHS